MRAAIQVLCAGLLFAASAASAPAQQGGERQARSYLESGMSAHQGIGYRTDPATPDVAVPLWLDHPYLWSVYLTRGQTYRAYGACDDRCSDLDMEIYGAEGNLVDRDNATNDTPYVQITPTESGRAYVRVWVYACAHEPCYAAMRLVAGGAAVARAGASVREPDIAQTQEGANQRAVTAELEVAGVAHEQAGYRQSGEDVMAPIALNREGHSWTLQLDGGVTYLFQGACDQQCTNADMEIRNAHGEQIAEDINGDDRPVVTITPPRPGEYTLRLWLTHCAREPCTAGFRMYRRVTN